MTGSHSCVICGLAFTRDVKARELAPHKAGSMTCSRFACEDHFEHPELPDFVPGPYFDVAARERDMADTLTMRDEFALRASDADIERANFEAPAFSGRSRAAGRYRVADAMLAERAKRGATEQVPVAQLVERPSSNAVRTESSASGAGSSPAGDATRVEPFFSWHATTGEFSTFETLDEARKDCEAALEVDRDSQGDTGWEEAVPESCYGSIAGGVVEALRRKREPGDMVPDECDEVVDYAVRDDREASGGELRHPSSVVSILAGACEPVREFMDGLGLDAESSAMRAAFNRVLDEVNSWREAYARGPWIADVAPSPSSTERPEQQENKVEQGTLPNVGDVFVTHAKLRETTGMFITVETLAKRRAGARGIYAGVVGGHGGDVWWIKHDDGAVAPYCFDELSPEDVAAPLEAGEKTKATEGGADRG